MGNKIRLQLYVLLTCSVIFMLGLDRYLCASEFHSSWSQSPDRIWVGPDYWANRLQDWKVSNGRLECLNTTMPGRTVHILTRRLGTQMGTSQMSVTLGLLATTQQSTNVAGGFLVGAGAAELDYRAAALVQGAPGIDGGYFAGITTKGKLIIKNNSVWEVTGKKGTNRGTIRKTRWKKAKGKKGGGNRYKKKGSAKPAQVTLPNVNLQLRILPDGQLYRMELSAFDSTTGKKLGSISKDSIKPQDLQGSIALVSGYGGRGTRFWFKDWQISGDNVKAFPERVLGAILGTEYTLSNNIMKMTAQMMPLSTTANPVVYLQIKNGNSWEDVAQTKIIVPGYTAVFRVTGWDSTKDVPYRVVYRTKDKSGQEHSYTWGGTIGHDPVDKDVITVAAFTGNDNCKRGFGQPGYSWNKNALWFPHNELYKHVAMHKPDILFFSGDQVYEGASPTAPDLKHIYLDYLYKWYLWYWSVRDMVRDIPCVTIPDDHDVYQGNLWGEGGRHIGRQSEGGYVRPAEFINMLQRTQTSNLPDPYDPTPVKQGITVYYTSLNWGQISFAVLEDRKFKTGELSAEAKSGDPTKLVLLGKRQLDFIRHWAADWSDGIRMKAALSQTVFCCQHTPRNLRSPNAGKPSIDKDSGGWPVWGRNRALRELRKGFAFRIDGDQHLATIIHQGIEDFDDSCWSFCVPSIANFFPRCWLPNHPGGNHQPGMPNYTGQYLDGFGNKMTVWAVANPRPSGHKPAALNDKSPGYGIVLFNKKSRDITIECWPIYADPRNNNQQYPGWPKTINMLDNYSRKAVEYLPELHIIAMKDPVVQIRDDLYGDIIYTLRIKGNVFRPKVFRKGYYTIKVGEFDTGKVKILRHIKSGPASEHNTITINF